MSIGTRTRIELERDRELARVREALTQGAKAVERTAERAADALPSDNVMDAVIGALCAAGWVALVFAAGAGWLG